MSQIEKVSPSSLLIMGLWIAIFMLYPFQFVSIFDIPIYLILTLIFSVSAIIFGRAHISITLKSRPVQLLSLFAGWCVLVNLYYSITLLDPAFMLDASRYGGVLLFVMSCFICLQREYNKYYYLMIMACIIAFSLVSLWFFLGDSIVPSKVGFSNINQLSRYALFIGVLLSLDRLDRKYVSTGFYIVLMSLVNLLVIFSLSRASSVAVLMLLLIVAFKDVRSIMFIVILSFIFGLIYQSVHDEELPVITKIEGRFQENSHEDKVLNRGYSRFLDYPKYIIFGAGERRNDRFQDFYEFHSSYGGVLWCYGIVGFVLMLSFHGYSFRYVDYTILLLFPLMFNSLVHNDMRFIFNWILPVLYFFRGIKLKSSNKDHVQIF